MKCYNCQAEKAATEVIFCHRCGVRWSESPPVPGSVLVAEDRIIVNLTRENHRLHGAIDDLKKEMDAAGARMAAVGVPTGFEDGNDWDDYGFGERVGVLAKMYQRASAQNND
jgi:hypothetical protein